jgi:hypothetical protein
MRVLLTGLSTLAGLLFTVGGPSNAAAQEARPIATGVVVMARQSPSMSTGYHDGQRKKLQNVLATLKLNEDKLQAQKKDTKPTKKTKSPREHH